MSKDKNDIYKAIVIIALVPVAYISHGYAISVLWDWFVVDAFNLAQISIVQGIGFWLMCRFFKDNSKFVEKTTDESLQSVLAGCIGPMIALGVAYIVLLFGGA